VGQGRLSVKESEFETIKEKLDLTPLSTNLNHSTYSQYTKKILEVI
jgi:hypothetical protein